MYQDPKAQADRLRLSIRQSVVLWRESEPRWQKESALRTIKRCQDEIRELKAAHAVLKGDWDRADSWRAGDPRGPYDSI